MSQSDLRFNDLRDFLELLEQRGQLKRITAPVSTELEMSEIADRTVKAGGPALLFEHPVGPNGQRLEMPVAMNLYGTRQRMAWALGVNDMNDIGDRLRSLIDVRLGGGLMGLMSNLPKLREVASLPPKRVRNAPVQQVVWRGDEVDLSRIPVLKTWPQDGGPFITLPLVVTKDPDGGHLNIGMYRMQVMDARTTAMHWQRHKTGARHYENAKRLGQRLEVAVAIGGDPALTYAATAPIPPIPGLNEYSLTGFLRSRSLELVKGVSVDLEVPANAEIVLEGTFDEEETRRKYGVGVAQRLSDFGIFGEKTIAAHGIYLDEKGMQQVTDSDTIVAHNPQSNMNNAVGRANIFALLDRGVTVGIGTDGMTPDVKVDVRTGYLMHKHSLQDPNAGWMAFQNMLLKNNPAIYRRLTGQKVGQVASGYLADVILVDYAPPTVLNSDTFWGHFLYGISDAPVDTTIINGKIVMENKRIAGIEQSRHQRRRGGLAADPRRGAHHPRQRVGRVRRRVPAGG